MQHSRRVRVEVNRFLPRPEIEKVVLAYSGGLEVRITVVDEEGVVLGVGKKAFGGDVKILWRGNPKFGARPARDNLLGGPPE